MKKTALSDKSKSILEKLKKNSTIEESDIFSDSELYTVKETYPTPIPIINLALSGKFFDGGVSRGSTVIAGVSKSFKTVISLFCLKAYMDKYDDAVGLIYDSEFSITPEYLSTFGIDCDRIFISPIEDIDKLKNDIVSQIDQIQKDEHVFILVDSIGNLASLKEISDAQEGKSVADMTRAKAVKSLFRMITPRVNKKNLPLFTINHVYSTMELYSKDIISGGQGVMLGANTAIIMSRRKNQNKEEEGYDFVIKIEKSRFIKEGLKFPLTVPGGAQIKKWSGLFDLALETGFILKEGMKYSVPEVPEFEKAWKKDIENSDEFWKIMFEKTTMVKTIENSVKVSTDQSSLFDKEDVKENLDIADILTDNIVEHSGE